MELLTGLTGLPPLPVFLYRSACEAVPNKFNRLDVLVARSILREVDFPEFPLESPGFPGGGGH